MKHHYYGQRVGHGPQSISESKTSTNTKVSLGFLELFSGSLVAEVSQEMKRNVLVRKRVAELQTGADKKPIVEMPTRYSFQMYEASELHL